jgi:ethanolamine-phosphate cytidylyltransferase
VIPNVVYTPSLHTLDEYNCSHVAHGDDIAIGADGKDCYHMIREQNRLLYFIFICDYFKRIVKRTEGISTTDIVGRLLMMSNEHHHNYPVFNKIYLLMEVKKHQEVKW